MTHLRSTIRLLTGSAILQLLMLPSAGYAQFDNEQSPAASLSDVAPRSAAVATVLDSPRDTPAQQLGAVFTLLDLGETEIAQTIWGQFDTAGLDDQAKTALVRQLGTARFLSLVRREATDGLEGARKFAESSLKAAATINSDPTRLSGLIAKLSDESAEVRRAARSDLSVTGDVGATVCLEALAKATDKPLRTELMLTLARMQPTVEPMLIACLADGQSQFRRDIIELVGHLHVNGAVPFLAAISAGADSEPVIVAAARTALSKMGMSQPSVGEARSLIREELRRLELTPSSPEIDSTWWIWHQESGSLTDPDPGELVSGPQPEQMIRKLSIFRLASILNAINSPTDRDRILELVYYYETRSVIGRAETRDVSSFSTGWLSEALTFAVDQGLIAAAVLCVNELGERADPAALNSVAGLPSALASTLTHSNRRLRFAALEAVMQIGPKQSFAGASGVPKSLWFFATGAGAPQVVVASSVANRSSDWAGKLRGLGYDALPVVTGRDAILTSLKSSRLELILVDSDVGRPLLREVIFGLRSNPPTAHTPIAVLSSLHNLTRAERIAERDPMLIATPRPHTDEALQTILAELAELGSAPQTADERSQQAVAALGWIAELLEQGHPYDELLRDANSVDRTVYVPELAAASMRVLAVLGTAGSQRTLLDVASSGTLPIETRREAGAAFAKSVEQFGKLLTSEEILRQYDRYNASETADRETQDVLGKLLDVLEK